MGATTMNDATESAMMLCHECGSVMEPRVLRLVENTQRGDPIVIRNVPAKVCARCGERVFSQSVTRLLLSILTGNEPATETITLDLPVYTMNVAA